MEEGEAVGELVRKDAAAADSVSAWVVFGEVRCHFGQFLMNLNQHFLDFQLFKLLLKISINLI